MAKTTEHKKEAGAVTVIHGEDGPTSVFFLGGKQAKLTWRQRFHRWRYACRKKYAQLTVKANPHSMEQTVEYIKTKWGFTEISKENPEYQSEYSQLRASFLLQYKPELVGNLSEEPGIEGKSEEQIREFMRKIDERLHAAQQIPAQMFDIDLHLLEKRKADGTGFRIILEADYGYIGGSASGDKKSMKAYQKILRAVNQYYGVSKEDIADNTQRYKNLVRALAVR